MRKMPHMAMLFNTPWAILSYLQEAGGILPFHLGTAHLRRGICGD